MLVELKVNSLGIIDELTWVPGCGLNIITGETGAGKSLVIDALNSLIDGRMDEGSIRHGSDLARMEGVFCFPSESLKTLAQLLSEKGVSLDDNSLVMSGEFHRRGRAVFRLNGSAVPRATLREAGHLLVNIHSQTEHLALFERQNHLDYLDTYGRTIETRERFVNLFSEFSRLHSELSALDQAQRDRAHREEILSYQVDEIKRAAPRDDEEQELTQERHVMASGEKLKALSYEACQALDGEDGAAGAALSLLHQVREALRRLAAIDPALKASLSLMEEAYINIEELSREMQSYQERLDFDPRRLEEIETRLELLRTLKKKYGGSVPAVREYLARAEEDLAGIASYSENRAVLEGKLLDIKASMGRLGEELSKMRQKAARKLTAAVKKELNELSLKQVVFEITLSRKADPAGLPMEEGNYAFNRTGVDAVEFMVSTNPGEPLKPLASIASTGEVSRFTLALKVALAEADKTPVLIFDEIDIGIGGRSGEVVGQKLWRLARHHQVICVTHLPQIAAYGDSHYRVQKEASGDRTVTRLTEVKDGGRLKELAAMVGGKNPGQASFTTAEELKAQAEAWITVRSRSREAAVAP